jgi:hypothetical protein
MITANVKDPHDRLLLIGHDPADAKVVREALANAKDDPFHVEWVTQLSDGRDDVAADVRAVRMVWSHRDDHE